MRRGEIWTVSGGSDYAGKSRPAVIVQGDEYADIKSVVVCLITTTTSEAPVVRLMIEPTDTNGLRATSRIMVDKISALSRSRLGRRIGRLEDEHQETLNRALLTFLGLL